uniref:Transmembrane protein n=1 Tax=Panagrellus redivivus TaxID=6233 RepID=A0A7E4VTQ0_PANRE
MTLVEIALTVFAFLVPQNLPDGKDNVCYLKLLVFSCFIPCFMKCDFGFQRLCSHFCSPCLSDPPKKPSVYDKDIFARKRWIDLPRLPEPKVKWQLVPMVPSFWVLLALAYTIKAVQLNRRTLGGFSKP